MKCFKLYLVCFFFLVSTVIINAEIVTVYQSVEPIDIYTKIGTATTMIFPAEIKTAVLGNQSTFSVQEIATNDGLVITPETAGVWTNLTVIDKDNEHYVFRLIEDIQYNFYNLVTVKTKENIPYSQIVNIMRNNNYVVDRSISKMISFYDLDEHKKNNDYIEIKILKAAIIKNTDQTVYWVKLSNQFNQDIYINSLGVEERELSAIITNDNIIKKGSSGEYFLIAKGQSLDNTLSFNFLINNREIDVVLEDIPYIIQKYRVFELQL